MAIIKEVRGHVPVVGEGTFLAETAVLIGDVTVGRDCSIWYGAVLRGDVNSIRIGDRTNIQDGAVVHTLYDGAAASVAGAYRQRCLHRAQRHHPRCRHRRRCLIGMGATVSTTPWSGRLYRGRQRAGAGREPAGAGGVYAGVPARRVKEVTPQQRQEIIERTARDYMLYASWYEGAEE